MVTIECVKAARDICLITKACYPPVLIRTWALESAEIFEEAKRAPRCSVGTKVLQDTASSRVKAKCFISVTFSVVKQSKAAFVKCIRTGLMNAICVSTCCPKRARKRALGPYMEW